MAQHAVELILTKQLASTLTVPIFLVDTEGNLLFYNEPAEAILGLRFEETGEMSSAEWGTRFHPTTLDGQPVAVHDLPLVRALVGRMPTHGPLRIVGGDGVARSILVTAFPLNAQGGRFLGAVAMFWEAG
jgi:PAS domain-containing protein